MKKTSLLLLTTLLMAAFSLTSCEKDHNGRGNGPANGFDSNGASNSLFTVGTGRQVRFSRGNLQYQISTGTWAFAENQYDYTGTYSSALLDLFGWGTSGWYNPAQSHDPTSTGNWNPDYWPGGNYENDLTGSCANADWGVYNAISNGGNQAGMWRTLTMKEWQVLLGVTADTLRIDKWGLATLEGGRRGLVILPDDWELPSGVTFTPGAHGWNSNAYSKNQWSDMESAGAIFLPAAGCRYGDGVDNAGTAGFYWSSTHFNEARAYCMNFTADEMDADNRCFRSNGCAVRLVMDR